MKLVLNIFLIANDWIVLISAVCAVLRADLNRMVKVNKQQYPHLNDHVPALLVVGAHRARVGKQLASVRVARTSRLASPTLCEVRPHSCVRCPVCQQPRATMCRNSAVCFQWTTGPLCLFCGIITCFCRVLHVVFSDQFSTVCMWFVAVWYLGIVVNTPPQWSTEWMRTLHATFKYNR